MSRNGSSSPRTPPQIDPDQASSSTLPNMPSTPPQPGSSSRTIASSPGNMSMSKRRQPPSWPRSRERIHTVSGSSETSTPSVLRVPPTPQYSPGQDRPPHSVSPAPLTAPYTPYRPYPSSAPPRSAARLPEHLHVNLQPSPTRPSYRLVGAPHEWVVKGLNRNAADVWNDPDSADIHVLVPLTPRHMETQTIASGSPHSPVQPIPSDPEDDDSDRVNLVSAQRFQAAGQGKLPGSTDVPVLVFPLHLDYLKTQSKLFCALLSPTSPHSPLLRPPSPRPAQPSSLSLNNRNPNSPLRSPGSKGMKIFPTPPGEPCAVFCPLPDPSSFGVLVHWLYWGNTESLEAALTKGLVTWQGLVRNIDYLEMDDTIKRAVGRWWRKWVRPATGRDVEVGRGDKAAWYQGSASDSERGSRRGKEDEGSGDEADGESEMDVEKRGGGAEGDDVAGLMSGL